MTRGATAVRCRPHAGCNRHATDTADAHASSPSGSHRQPCTLYRMPYLSGWHSSSVSSSSQYTNGALGSYDAHEGSTSHLQVRVPVAGREASWRSNSNVGVLSSSMRAAPPVAEGVARWCGIWSTARRFVTLSGMHVRWPVAATHHRFLSPSGESQYSPSPDSADQFARQEHSPATCGATSCHDTGVRGNLPGGNLQEYDVELRTVVPGSITTVLPVAAARQETANHWNCRPCIAGRHLPSLLVAATEGVRQEG